MELTITIKIKHGASLDDDEIVRLVNSQIAPHMHRWITEINNEQERGDEEFLRASAETYIGTRRLPDACF